MLERARSDDKRASYLAELEAPPFPMALLHVWNAFIRLSRRRGSSGFGISAIAWADIDAFVRHAGIRLAPWEIGLIEDLDDLYRAELGKKED